MIFVCFLWGGLDTRRSYTSKHVRVLRSMLRRSGGHSLVCITNDRSLVPGVDCDEVIPLPSSADLPGFYPKLYAHSAELHRLIGQRFAVIDLDVVVMQDPALVDRGGDLCIWRDPSGRELYNSSLMFITPFGRNDIWDSFSVERAESARSSYGSWTGDQSWIAVVCGEGLQTFDKDSGVFQYRPHHRFMRPASWAVAWFMCGPYDPAVEAVESNWVGEYWK